MHHTKSCNETKRKQTANQSPFFNFLDEVVKDAFYGNGIGLTKSPRANVLETDDSYRIELATPGLSKKDFQLKIDKNKLTIKVEKEATTAEGETFKRKEFDYHHFNKSFNLSDKIDQTSIKAAYKNGVLIVTLPKKEEAKEQAARTIDIS